MAPQELILSAPAASTGKSVAPQTSAAAIHLHDLLTSSSIAAFKTSQSSVHSLGYVQTQNGLGGGVFAVQEDKAMMHIWAWQKDQMHLKLHLPEKMTCFAVSPNGCWAAAGSPNGHIYLWELASGLLVSSHTGHYRAVASLTFTSDSRLLISTSLDSSAHIYLVSRLVDPEDSADAGKPYGVLKDHTLGVRCVGLGVLGEGGRLWTASDDGTAKMWSLAPPFDLLCTFTLPPSSSPTTLAVDPSERFFYVGTTQGTVYHVPLFRKRSVAGEALSSEEWEAVSGVNGTPIKTEGAVIALKEGSITSLALSISSTHLLIGTSVGTIQIHALPSHQHLRTLAPHAGPVTYISTILRPSDLFGGVTKEDVPVMEIKTLERMKIKSAREAHNPVLLLRPPPTHLANLLSSLKRARPAPKLTSGTVAGGQGDEMEKLMEENRKLKLALEKAGRINEKMWTGILDMKLGEGA